MVPFEMKKLNVNKLKISMIMEDWPQTKDI